MCGCAATRSTADRVGGWIGLTPVTRPDASIRPSAWYAASAGVAVRAAPDASSEVVAQLARHDPVLRYQRKDGFAFVVAEKGNRSGWVAERALIERLPAAPRAAPASGVPAEPDAEAVPTPPAEPGASEPPVDEETAPAAPPEKSVFDPY